MSRGGHAVYRDGESLKLMMSQSGFQITYGGGSMGPEMKQLEDLARQEGGAGQSEGQEAQEGPKWSFLTALAFLAVLGGAVISLAGMLGASSLKLHPKITAGIAAVNGRRLNPGLLTGIALVFLFFSAVIIGFPVERQVKEQMKDQPADAEMMSFAPQVKMDVSYRWPLYLELLTLSVPTFLLLNERFHWVALGGTRHPTGGVPGPAA